MVGFGRMQSTSTLKSSRFETCVLVSKLLLLVVGTITTVVTIKIAIFPCTFNLIVSTLPSLWISLRAWLSPPYVYILVNFIIITIAASSSFQKPHFISKSKLEEERRSDETRFVVEQNDDAWKSIIEEEEEEKEIVKLADHHELACEEPVIERIAEADLRRESKDLDENRQEDVSLESVERVESLEEAWKLIMEKRGRRQLNKCDTWHSPPRVLEKAGNELGDDGEYDAVSWDRRELRKSDTFNDTVSLRRKKSMSQDELNQKVEEFIKKFNHEMKMQRQESDQLLVDMVDRSL